MGKDKAKPTPPSASAATPAPALAPGTRPPKGHKQRGAGTVIVAKPAVVTGDGIVLKAHERLPCQLLQEYCQKEKRPNAKFIHASPGPKFRVVLPDSKNSKNDLTFCPTQTFPSDSVARDFAALLALFHLQRQFPLERRMPEPYASSWLSMIAAEKEQTKQTGADSKNTKTTPMSSSTVASTSAQSTPSAATAAGPGVALAGSKADKAEADQGASKNSSKGSNSNLAAIAASLNRDTSDWLCDNCSNQNFALLASGQPRVKCFRCGTPKSATCQLVASSTTAIPTTAASTTASSTSSAPAKPAIAAVNLLVGKNANYVSKAEEERAVQEKRALQKRKQYYFDALRRANRPHIVHIPTALRVKLERLLGMTTSGCNSSYGEEGGEELSLEEVLQTYQESGLFPPDLCNMTTDQQMSILQRVSKHLLGQGFSVQYVASSLREVLLQSANDLLDDAIDTAEGSADSSAGLDSRKVSATFEKLLSEACLKNLCMTVEESALPDAYNPKFFENSKKLSVVSAPVALGAPPSTASPALSVQKAGSVSSGSASASASAVNDGPAVDLLATVDPELRPVLLQLCVYCNCFLASSLSVTTATATTAITQEDCKTAMLTAVSLLPSFPTATSNGYGGPHDRKIQFLALLILQEASLFTPASAQQLLSPALQRLRSCCTAESDASTADFSEVADEIESLQAIFEDNVRSTLTSDGHLAHYYVTLKITLEHLQRARQSKHVLKSLGSLDLMIIVHQLAPYPTQVPLIYLHSSCSSGAVGKMTAGAAAAVCALQTQLRQKAAEFAGELMIFQLYSYLQECIDNIATASAMGGASAVSATSTSVSAEEGEGAESGVSARLPVVSNRLAAISAYLTGNDALYDTLIQASQVPSSNAAASTATDTGAKKGDTEADRAADIDASDSYTVTTAATETTSTFTSNSNSSSVAPNKYNQGTRKGPNVHSFWSPIPSNDATNNASSSATQSKAMLESRRKLPSWNKREEVINLVQSNRAIVVTGETGCGKTTQVPQFLYETNPQQKIVICQPRRLAAVGVATRVAEEVGCAVGQEVGYMVKGDSQTSARTRIAFCTYGVLLRRLQVDPTLCAITTVILDEVHERGMDSDFTLALLMFALCRRPDLKIILMSATISTEHFATYLGKWLGTNIAVPVLFIPGYTFPVLEFYKADYEDTVRQFRDFTPAGRQQDPNYDDMDTADSSSSSASSYYIGGYPRKGEIDYDLLTRLVMVLARGYSGDTPINPATGEKEMYTRAQGSILVFMPGVPEISKLARLLQSHWRDGGSGSDGGGSAVPRLKIMPLHGNLSPSEQKMVFSDAKRGELKVVIATNVAEASVTIPDVTVVIDTCRVKEMSFDAEIQTAALMTKFAAKDSLRQRKGRAGRVQKGRCFRLITKGTFEKLPDHSVPEILRVPLEKIVLQVKAMLNANSSLFVTQTGAAKNSAAKGAKGGGVSGTTASASVANSVTSNNTMTLLCRCPDVPTATSVTAAELLLTQIQALDASTGALTPLGRHLATLPCMPRVGRLAIFGAMLGCVYAATAVAAGMTVRTPFITSQDAEVVRCVNAAKDQFSGGSALRSDYTLLVYILREYETVRNKRSFCKQYGLSQERINEIQDTQRDLLTGLVEIGLLRSVREAMQLPPAGAGAGGAGAGAGGGGGGVNRNAHKSRLVTATLCAGIYPQLAKIMRPTKRFVEVAGGAVERDLQAKELKFYIPLSSVSGGGDGNSASGGASASATTSSSSSAPTPAHKPLDKRNIDISTEDQMRVFLHPSSCNFTNSTFKESNFIMYGERQLVSYNNATTGTPDTKVYLRDTTEASAFALLFFGGKLEADYSDGTVTVDGWIRFTAPGRIVAIIQEIRHAFDGILQAKFESPSTDISALPVVDLACQLLDLNALY